MKQDHTLTTFRLGVVNFGIRLVHWAIRCNDECSAHTFLVKPYKNKFGLLTLALTYGEENVWATSVASIEAHDRFIEEQERMSEPEQRRGSFTVVPGGRK